MANEEHLAILRQGVEVWNVGSYSDGTLCLNRISRALGLYKPTKGSYLNLIPGRRTYTSSST
jgi:hypothetical protein